MNLSREVLFFFSLLGCFNTFLFSLYFLFFKKGRDLSDKVLGLLLFSLSIRICKSVIWWFNPQVPFLFIQLGLIACLFIGPLLFSYVIIVKYNSSKFPIFAKISLAILAIISVGVSVCLSLEEFKNFWRLLFVPIVYIIWLISVLSSGWIIRDTIKSSFFKIYTLDAKSLEVLLVYSINFIVVIFYTLSFFNLYIAYIIAPIIFSFLAYSLLLIYLKSFSKQKQLKLAEKKYLQTKLDNSLANTLIIRLEKLMEEKKIYTDPELKISNLAELMGITSHQLSQLLNDNLSKNFNTYINDYRIKLACTLLTEDNGFKLEAIANEVGFNSKSAFFTYFKKTTGLTPKLYREVKLPHLQE